MHGAIAPIVTFVNSIRSHPDAAILRQEMNVAVKVYYRKLQLAARYSTSVRSIDRMVSDGRLPPPDLYMGPHPMWADETIEANERAVTMREPPPNHRHAFTATRGA